MRATLRAWRAHRFLLTICLCGIGRGAVAATTGVDLPTGPAEAAFASEVAQAGGPSAADVLKTLSGAKLQPTILDAIARPAEATRAWKDYRPIFITDRRIADGVAFYREHRELFDRIGAAYGVAPEVVIAIIGVETSYGRITGRYRVLDALATLAFHYPPRGAFFRGELKQLFLLGDHQLAYPVEELRGSYAGAMGWGQFMPSSVAQWARDEDGDGRIDLWNSLPDIAASVANYFAAHGWQAGQPVALRAQPADGARELPDPGLDPVYPMQQMEAWGYAPTEHVDADVPATLLRLEGERGPEYWLLFANFRAITRYNRSPLYAMAVWQLAQAIRAGAAAPAP
jgi:membrane-bound lytic murein transglycosylase B